MAIYIFLFFFTHLCCVVLGFFVAMLIGYFHSQSHLSSVPQVAPEVLAEVLIERIRLQQLEQQAEKAKSA